MTRRRTAVWSVGIGFLAAAAIAASQGAPVEALSPPNGDVPAAESVETVLRATYVLPEGRGQELAAFLGNNAAPGIDVRADQDRLTVVAPADAQKALGAFIEKCIGKEPRPRLAPGPMPDFGDPFGSPQPVRKRASPVDAFATPPDDGFQPPPKNPSTPFVPVG